MSLEHLDIPCEVKAATDAAEAEEGVFEGYGSVFNNVDLGKDVILPGAFKGAVARRVKLLWQHDPRQPIGVYDELEEDEKGLRLKGRLALKTARGAEAYELLKMGALDGLSIGFTMGPKDFEYDAKTDIRSIKKVKLMEVSLVTWPMNPRATTTRVKADGADVDGALDWLRRAIVLHQAHMDGSEPTSDASQMKMMRQMLKAYELLGGEPIEADGMGDDGKGKKPKKPMSMPMKSAATKRDLEHALRDAGLSASEAKYVVGLTDLPPVPAGGEGHEPQHQQHSDPSATPGGEGDASINLEPFLRELRDARKALQWPT